VTSRCYWREREVGITAMRAQRQRRDVRWDERNLREREEKRREEKRREEKRREEREEKYV